MADKIVSTYEFETKQAVKNVNDLASQMNFLIKGLGEVEKASNKTKTATEKLRTSGFNPLNASINQFTRELPNAAISAQVFITSLSNQFGALQDAINGITESNKKLAAEGKKTQSVLGAVSKALFSWGTLLQIGVTLLVVYGKEIGNLISSLFKGAEAFNEAKERIKSLNTALESKSVNTAIENIRSLQVNINLAKKGIMDKDVVLKQYNTTLGQTAGEVTTLDGVERSLIENGRAYVRLTLFKAAANAALQKSVEKTIEAEELRIKRERSLLGTVAGALNPLTGVDITGVAARQQANQILNAEKTAADLLKISSDFQAKAAQIAKDNDLLFLGNLDEIQRAEEQAEKERLRKKEQAEKDLLALQKEAFEDANEFARANAEAEFDRNKKRIKEAEEAEKAIVELRAEAYDELTKLARIDAEAEDARNKKRVQAEKELNDLRIRLAETFSNEFFNLQSNLSSAEADEQLKILEENKEKELEAVGNNRKKQAQIEAEYDRKRAEILNRNAQTQRTLQLSEIAVNTALAVAKAIAESPLTFGLPFSAFALAQGAIQYAFASSQPLPKYAKGTERVTGGIKGQDSVMALLMPDEAVIKATENVRHPGLAKAWNHGNLDQFLAMNYLAPALDELSRKAQVSVNNSYSNSTNNSFSDRKIVKSMQENTMVNRLILRKIGASGNDWNAPKSRRSIWNKNNFN